MNEIQQNNKISNSTTSENTKGMKLIELIIRLIPLLYKKQIDTIVPSHLYQSFKISTCLMLSNGVSDLPLLSFSLLYSSAYRPKESFSISDKCKL